VCFLPFAISPKNSFTEVDVPLRKQANRDKGISFSDWCEFAATVRQFLRHLCNAEQSRYKLFRTNGVPLLESFTGVTLIVISRVSCQQYGEAPDTRSRLYKVTSKSSH
jgi:hypothetical protein